MKFNSNKEKGNTGLGIPIEVIKKTKQPLIYVKSMKNIKYSQIKNYTL